ncbi:uncharacterized protein KD926_008033 [Aspergillus affinis]|uniref:uncharacterized protein n=1 Tax=Aspergillus affinis TaxID=1070780 RepID=UPI0022FE8E26|nr:uncharacterized protein KD926_008033 [Aspergillus affinis]KAI9045617.1 hypothetical protein KD926_008033 [Aspergillus affinis]
MEILHLKEPAKQLTLGQDFVAEDAEKFGRMFMFGALWTKAHFFQQADRVFKTEQAGLFGLEFGEGGDAGNGMKNFHTQLFAFT